MTECKKKYETLLFNLTLISVLCTQLTSIVFTFIWSNMSTPFLHTLESFTTLRTRTWFAVTVFALVCSNIGVIVSDPLLSLTSCYRRKETLTSSSNTLYISSLEHWTDCVITPSSFDVMFEETNMFQIIFHYVRNQLTWTLDLLS